MFHPAFTILCKRLNFSPFTYTSYPISTFGSNVLIQSSIFSKESSAAFNAFRINFSFQKELNVNRFKRFCIFYLHSFAFYFCLKAFNFLTLLLQNRHHINSAAACYSHQYPLSIGETPLAPKLGSII